MGEGGVSTWTPSQAETPLRPFGAPPRAARKEVVFCDSLLDNILPIVLFTFHSLPQGVLVMTVVSDGGDAGSLLALT